MPIPNRILNIHPALLPDYGGKGMYGSAVHEAVVAAHEKESGISIHYVDEFMITGGFFSRPASHLHLMKLQTHWLKKFMILEYRHYPEQIARWLESFVNNN